jgi:antirestriction protein ArdC
MRISLSASSILPSTNRRSVAKSVYDADPLGSSSIATLNLPMDFENSARYVGGWLKKLKEDKRELLHAAADAEKIAAYVLAWHPDYRASHEPRRPKSPTEEAPGLVA